VGDLPQFEQFFAHRRLSPFTAFTPAGERVLFGSNLSGQFNLWSVSVDGGWPEQLTAFTANTVRAVAVRDDGEILFSADRDGNEYTQLYRIATSNPWPEQLTDLENVQHLLEGGNAWSPDGRRYAYSANARRPTDSEIWIADAAAGEPVAVFGEGRFAFPFGFSPDGTQLLALDFRANDDQSIFVVDLDSNEAREVTEHEGRLKFLPGPWARDGSGFFLLTNEGRDYVGLAFHDLGANARRWVETPERDLEFIAGSADGSTLAWIENDDGWARIRLRDLEADRDLPEPKLPHGTVSVLGPGLSLSRDGSRLAIVWEQPERPPELHVVETATGEARALTENRFAGLGSLELASPELIRYPSFDGREIPAWLYKPANGDPAPFVVAIHGGPEAQERPTYRGLYQYLLSRGIGVLAPNVRGSTGYGTTYQKLIYRDWGGGDLEDFKHAAEWLRAQDFVDPDRLGVYGGSYGGFATLSCVTRLPEYWAGAVDIFGPSDLVTFARAVPPTWRRFMAEWVGDPETEEEFLRERSPITYVEDTRAPLLVIQGATDPRVVKAESDQMVERLRDLGRVVAYEVFEDEGHGFTRVTNELRAYSLAADWLQRHLAGNGRG
jgi:dipeptidyl aminopeptidase/acylaminoacyl peptidase